MIKNIFLVVLDIGLLYSQINMIISIIRCFFDDEKKKVIFSDTWSIVVFILLCILTLIITAYASKEIVLFFLEKRWTVSYEINKYENEIRILEEKILNL